MKWQPGEDSNLE